MVVGSRPLDGSVAEERHSHDPPGRRAAFRALARRIVPGATDTQCGFKFFAGPLARSAARSLRTAGFAFDVELLALPAARAPRTEIPVIWRDVPGSTFSVRRHGRTFRDSPCSDWPAGPGQPGRARADHSTASRAPPSASANVGSRSRPRAAPPRLPGPAVGTADGRAARTGSGQGRRRQLA